MRYNHLLNSHFSSCPFLAAARDTHRNRDVRIYCIPGDFSLVGVTDGVDAWLAPTLINPFSVNVQRLLEDYRQGKRLDPQPFTPRRKINAPKEEVKQAAGVRRRVIQA